MKIGLIDTDGHHFPNLPLMKLSAWHKSQGDHVEWYYPLISGHMDRVYMSKVFSFSPTYDYFIDSDEVVKGGSGFAITTSGGVENYDKTKDKDLPEEVEHIYPDYSLYPSLTENTAYGFLSRGCPRGCNFCHVKDKEGKRSYKVADLSEFWRGQKNIVICDPNILACREWEDLLGQLIESKSYIDFNQGLDIRLMDDKRAEAVKKIKAVDVHFAWDRYQDKDMITEKFLMFKDITGWNARKMIVYVLTNFDTTIEQDMERIYWLRDNGFDPYVMIYDKANADDTIKQLGRWCNNRKIFKTVKRFEDYKK